MRGIAMSLCTLYTLMYRYSVYLYNNACSQISAVKKVAIQQQLLSCSISKLQDLTSAYLKMTIIHIVLFKIKSSLDEATVQEVSLQSPCLFPPSKFLVILLSYSTILFAF